MCFFCDFSASRCAALRIMALLRRKRIAIVAYCCIASQLVARLIVAQASGLWTIVPLPVFGPMTPEVARTWDILAIWSYLPLSARLGSLSMGVLTALAVSEERLRQNISRQDIVSKTCLQTALLQIPR